MTKKNSTDLYALFSQLEPSWFEALKHEPEKPYFKALNDFLEEELLAGKEIFPQPTQWLTALNKTPLKTVKVVILGQDPYPTPGHAHGLSFSVMPDVSPLPKSLKNIYQELAEDLNIVNQSGYLMPWAEQGVLLLNAVLSVEKSQAGSHQRKGWELLTDAIIQVLNQQPQKMMFVLWGANAQKKGRMINRDQHAVIESPHPSPLSAYRGFFGSRPFSQVNQFLQDNQLKPIEWRLP